MRLFLPSLGFARYVVLRSLLSGVVMQTNVLFPLHAVLFPGTRIALRIFEQRYLEMIKDCLKNEQDFIVVLISKGQEVGLTPQVFSVGTRARVVDWNQMPDGLLSVIVEGGERVFISQTSGHLGELLMGETDARQDCGVLELSTDAELIMLLQKLQRHPLVQAQGMAIDYQDLNAVVWALGHLLPLSMVDKQRLLEEHDRQQRYLLLRELLQALDS